MTLEQAVEVIKQHTEQSQDPYYIICVDNERYLLKLHTDGIKYLPSCQYKRFIKYDKGYAPEFLWTLQDTIEFVSTFITYDRPYLTIVSKRKYGEPKLSKPKEIKGLKANTIEFIPKKCKFQYFKNDSDLWILCRDFFSPIFKPPVEDNGMPLDIIMKKYFNTEKHSKNFVYPDTWGAVVLRSEAWLCFKNYTIINKQSKNKLQRNSIFKTIFINGLLKMGYVIREDDFYWQNFIERLRDEVYE